MRSAGNLRDDFPVVNAAAALLSNLTQFAGVVLTPKRAQLFRQI